MYDCISLFSGEVKNLAQFPAERLGKTNVCDNTVREKSIGPVARAVDHLVGNN